MSDLSFPGVKIKFRATSEQMFFVNNIPPKTNDLIYVERSGITLPSPNYCMERIRSSNTLFTVFVFEYIYSGYGYVEMEGKKYKLCPGDMYVLGARSSHKYYPDANDPFKKIWINVRGTAISALMDMYFPDFSLIVSQNASPEYFEEMRDIFSSFSSYTDMNCEISAVLFKIMLRIHQSNPFIIKQPSNHAKKAKSIIDKSYDYKLTVKEIGKAMNLDACYVSKLFKEAYGTSIKQYLLDRKFDAAKELLRNEELSLEEISEELSFSSTYQFNTAFKAFIGITPTEYRHRQSNNKKDGGNV